MKRLQLAAAVTVLLALAGCTPEAASTPTPSPLGTRPTATAVATSTPTPTATVAPVAELAIPDCETLMTLAQAQEAFNGNTTVQFLGEYGINDLDSNTFVQLGMDSADPVRFCMWGRPNSGLGVRVSVGVLAPADRDALMAALAADGYSSVTMGTVTGMERSAVNDGDEGGTHLFTGDLWIGVPGGNASFTGNIAGIVLDSMRTANPSLGL